MHCCGDAVLSHPEETLSELLFLSMLMILTLSSIQILTHCTKEELSL